MSQLIRESVRAMARLWPFVAWLSAFGCKGQDIDAWDRALQRHVSAGFKDGIALNVVDYPGMAADPDFHSFLNSVSNVALGGLPEAQWRSLLINVYNAFAINMIVTHACKNDVQGQISGPVASIGDIGGRKGAVWSMPAGFIGGQPYSLKQVEDLLRKPPSPFSADPRIHACIVCASVSCPNLRPEAYRVETLSAQMEDSMRSFLSHTQKGMALNRATRTMLLSSIFHWDEADFRAVSGTVQHFVAAHVASASDQAFLMGAELAVTYIPWDRNVNGSPQCTAGIYT